MWLSKHWGVQGTGRGYVGTSGAAPNAPNNIKGPFVSEYYFAAGPEWLGPHNKHGAILAHVLVGGVYGKFQKDLLGQPPSVVGFYNDQVAPAAIVGGHFDLNRSAHWVFRITPDALVKRYSINYAKQDYPDRRELRNLGWSGVQVHQQEAFDEKRQLDLRLVIATLKPMA